MAQISTIPTRKDLVDEIMVLQFKLGQCNDTIVSQANELTTLRSILCRTCKHKLLDTTLELDSFLLPPGNRPRHGLPNLSISNPILQASSSTSVHQASLPPTPTFPVHFHSTLELPAFQSSSQLISTTLPPQPGTLSSSEAAATPLHDPPPGRLGRAEKPGALSSSHMNTQLRNPRHNPNFPWSVVRDPTANKKLGVTLEHTFTHNEQVRCVKFSLDGKYLGVGLSGKGALDGRVLVYSTGTGKRTCQLEHTEKEQSGIRPVCFSPNGKQVAVGYSDGCIRLWMVITNRVRSIFKVRRQIVNSLDFSPNGKSIVSASGNTVHVWSLRDGSSRVLENGLNRTRYLCVRFSPDGKYIAAADWDGFLRIWDSHTHQLVMEWYAQQKFVTSLAFLPDGKGLVSGGFGSTIKCWHVTTLKVILFRQIEGHTDSISSIAIAADGQWLLSASEDGTACLWDIANGTQQCSIRVHPGQIWSVDINPVENYLAIGDSEGQVSLWRYKVRSRVEYCSSD